MFAQIIALLPSFLSVEQQFLALCRQFRRASTLDLVSELIAEGEREAVNLNLSDINTPIHRCGGTRMVVFSVHEESTLAQWIGQTDTAIEATADEHAAIRCLFLFPRETIGGTFGRFRIDAGDGDGISSIQIGRAHV